jgi:hypothetical protein
MAVEAPDFIPLNAVPAPKNIKVPDFIPLGKEAKPVAQGPSSAPPPGGYIAHAWETTKAAAVALTTSPLQAGLGGVKALASGALSLAELSAEGLYGVASSKTIGGYSQEGAQAAKQFTQHVRDVSAAVTHINLSPTNKEQEVMGNLLSLLPEGITAAGDTVYEKTGSALAGAGTQALLTLLTLKPGVGGKVLERARLPGETETSKAASTKISAAFDELAAKNPEGATAVAEHVGQADKKTAQYLKNRIKKFTDASEEELGEIGRKAAKANLKELEAPPIEEIIKSGTVKPTQFKEVGKTPEGKPRVRAITSEQVGAQVRNNVKEIHELLNEPEKPKPVTEGDPKIVYMHSGIPITREHIEAAFRIGRENLDKIPGMAVAAGKLAEYTDQIIRNVAPEAKGIEARKAAAIIAKAMAKQLQRDSSHYTRSGERRTFWLQRSDAQRGFIEKFESGQPLNDPLLDKARQAYKSWNRDIAEQDRGLGFEYEEQDHYMAHIFEDGKGAVNFLKQKYGTKWGDPGFIKERSFALYEEARKAGFTPKFENPEDIMLARQHASDVAGMKVQVLRDLEREGLARKMTKQGLPAPEDFPATQRRSPNGDWYWVHNNAFGVVHNAFDSASLWNMKGMGGDAFRGAMALKNRLVPIKLAMSLFHPIHVATIDNATGMVRASKELLSGKTNPLTWLKDMGNAARYKGIIDNPRTGSRLLKVWQGKLGDHELTSADKQALQYMFEGGMIPEMSAQYRTHAVQNFKDALARRSLATVWHLPDAIISKLQGVMFEKWIPSLKIASYLKDVQTALKVSPELISKPMDRQLAFRRLAKSVDNRYGEMAYGTLFWNKWVKDLAVANTLSLGWQMGFIREYGGGAIDVGQALAKPGELVGKAKSGLLDRPLFVAFYSAQAMLYGGLMTYAFTGKPPQELIDYVYPQTGDTGPDGKPSRSTTMFYPREFFAIAKHIELEGVAGGLADTASSKASGLVGLAAEWAKGVNDFGQEIRDPNAPAYKQLEQTLAYSLSDLEPISLQAIQKDQSGHAGKSAALAISGFGPAPKYITETKTEGGIKQAYDKYVRPKETSYDKFVYSKDVKSLQQAYAKDDPKYDKLLDEAQDKYDLKADDIKRLEKQFRREDEFDATTYMFSRLDWQQQRTLLDKMPPEEREKYLPHSNKKHLRDNYEPPEDAK